MRVFYFLFCLVLIIGCSEKSTENIHKTKETIYVDAETVSEGLISSSDGKYRLFGGKFITQEKSFSGKKSLKLSKKNTYGFSFTYSDLFPDEFFRVTAWCYGDASKISLVADGIENEFYRASNHVIADSNEWSLMELKFYLPPQIDFKKLKLYVWNREGGTVYIDDFRVEKSPGQVFPQFDVPALQIYIDTNDLAHLRNLRLKAYQLRFIETRENSYVKAKIIYNQDTLKGKIRFKGDFFAHLEGEKWSFRIKLKKKYSWNGMNTFSIHHPKARGYLDEKIIHDLCRSNDILATRYGLVPVYLNGKNLGLYAYEEHFRKELVESLKRREGVIIKSNEDAMFFNSMLRYDEKISSNIPYYESSVIEPFQENKTAKSDALYNQFLIGQNLMYQFRNNLKPASAIFELNKLAKYLAIVDIMAGYHGVHWHNMRLYFNPVIMKLEPISFDNYSGGASVEDVYLGKYMFNKDDHTIYTKGTISLFKDNEFVNKYLGYLTYYAENIDDIMASVLNDEKAELAKLKVEFPFYKPDDYYKTRAIRILNNFDQYKAFIHDTLQGDIIEYKPETKHNYEFDKDIPEYLVKVYISKTANEGYKLTVCNYLNKPIGISGYYKDTLYTLVKNNVYVKPLDETYIPVPVKMHNEITRLKFVVNEDKVYEYQVTVNPWPKPDGEIKTIQNRRYGFDQLSKLGVINGKNIVFNKGYHKITSPIIVPEGYQLIFKPGAIVDILNGAAFISYSPINALGSINNRVVVKSSDGSAKGFTILQTKQKNVLKNVTFDQLNTLDLNGWKLTGAVNFYESDVEMTGVHFTNNRCEDALNIIKSRFDMSNCTFDNIFADAFDSDFSEGSIINSSFRDVGNDAIDFSGSKVTINSCDIYAAGDKGISGGENSLLTIKNVEIRKVNIGIASKDKSIITASKISIIDCEYGLTVFAKKPEYGPAQIVIDQIEILNTNTDMIIEEKSSVTIEGELRKGDEEDVADMFYL